MPRPFSCLLLCEDAEQRDFFSPILKRLFSRVHVEPIKPKQPGGFTFVFQSYAKLVRGIVRRYPQEARGLVVVLDGDEKGLRRRLDELEQCLKEAGNRGRDSDEKIATCVPCRNIETWELWLCGRRDVCETEDYKAIWHAEKHKGKVSVGQGVEAWFMRLSDEAEALEKERLPSLAAGRMELKQLCLRATKG